MWRVVMSPSRRSGRDRSLGFLLLGYLAILPRKFSFGKRARISPFINRSAWLIARNISARDAYLHVPTRTRITSAGAATGWRKVSLLTFTRGWVTVTRPDELSRTHSQRVPRSATYYFAETAIFIFRSLRPARPLYTTLSKIYDILLCVYLVRESCFLFC